MNEAINEAIKTQKERKKETSANFLSFKIPNFRKKSKLINNANNEYTNSQRIPYHSPTPMDR